MWIGRVGGKRIDELRTPRRQLAPQVSGLELQLTRGHFERMVLDWSLDQGVVEGVAASDGIRVNGPEVCTDRGDRIS